MHLNKITLFVCLCCLSLLKASAQKLDWVKTAGGVSADFCWDLTLHSTSEIISAGSFSDTLDFSNGLGIGILGSKGVGDGYILKSDTNGNFIWVYGLGGNGDDEVLQVASDDSGNVFALGYFSNTVDFDQGPAVNMLSSNGAADIFLLKISPTGNFIWVKQLGGISIDYAYGIAMDTAANILICGEFRNTVDFDPGTAVSNASSQGVADIFILKLNANGEFIWVKTMGGSGLDQGRAIALDKNQNPCITGRFSNTVDFDPNSGIFNLTTNGFFEAFVLKLDTAGNFKWVAGFEGTSENDSYSIALDSEQSIYTTGTFSQQCDFDPGASSYNLFTTANLSDHDLFVSKLDSNGNFVWAISMGDSGSAVGYSLAIDDVNNVVVTGIYDGLIDLNPGADTLYANAPGSPDGFVLKLSNYGEYLWAGNIGLNNYSYSQSIACGKGDAIYFAGYYFDEVDFDLGLKEYALPGYGSTDIFMEKLQACSSFAHSVLIGGDLTLCPGDTISLTADYALSYSWNTEESSQTIYVADSGFYYLTVRDSDFCIGTFSGVRIEQDTLPGAAGIISGSASATACLNQLGLQYSVDTIANANFYTWTFPPTVTIQNGNFTPQITVDFSAYSQSGNIIVSGVNSCGAGPSSILAFSFNPIPVAAICRTTIDSALQKTTIEWQKPAESHVNGYVIYRETPPLSGIYLVLDTIPNSLYSSFLDTSSQPALHPESYKIAVLDSCGNIGDTSTVFIHQTSRLFGSILPGGIAKIYWTDYIGIDDSTRYFNLLRDTIGNGPFTDTLYKNISPIAVMNATDPSSANYPLCRYVAEMVFESNCTPGLRNLASRSTSRSNIKNKTALFDSSGVGVSELVEHNFVFKLYPNPAKAIVRIELTGSNSDYRIGLMDLLGRNVISEQHITNKENITHTQLRLQSIESGIYFIVIENALGIKKIEKLCID